MYISEQQLKGFDSYKYRCLDTSPLSKYVMHPFWNQFVKLCPRWVAPNLLTFSGFMLLVIQFIILSVYDPVMNAAITNSIPTWVWWFCAFAQFFSHTLDGIDGKQARRTGTSSPLGELFDHGLDSWCVAFFTINVYSIFGSTVETTVYTNILYTTLIAFMLSHWEKYNTGVLYLPWGYDLSQVALFVIYVITAIWSVEIWKVPPFGISYTTIFQAITYSFVPLISPILSFVLVHGWIVVSPCDVRNSYPRLALLLISVVFSNILCRLVVSQMSGTRCQVINKFIFVLGVGLSATVYFNDPTTDYYLLVGVTTFLIVAHVHYGITVVRTLADHFGIMVFSIGKKKD